MKPTMFIGSSREFLKLAHAVKTVLKDDIESVVWDQNVFALTSNTLEQLITTARNCDLATFVLGEDDVALIRTNLHLVARDNVLFELGMFMGAMAKERCFFIVPRDQGDFHVPSDLAGITAAQFDRTTLVSNPERSVADPCNAIRSSLEGLQQEGGHSGSWIHSWTTDDEVPLSPKQTNLDLLQLGPYIRGVFVWDGVKYGLRGKIDRGNIVTAEYRSLAGPHGYFGTLHMVIRPEGTSMRGRWAGWSSNGGAVRSGRCEWTKS